MSKKKPTLHLTGHGKSAPTFDDIAKLYEAMTGKKLSREEYDAERAYFDKLIAEKAPSDS